jgi:hypothetical protein
VKEMLTIQSIVVEAATFVATFKVLAQGLLFLVQAEFEVFGPQIFALSGESSWQKQFYTLNGALASLEEELQLTLFNKQHSDAAGQKWLEQCFTADIEVLRKQLHMQHVSAAMQLVSKKEGVERYSLLCYMVVVEYLDLDIFMDVYLADTDIKVYSYCWSSEDRCWVEPVVVLANWLASTPN